MRAIQDKKKQNNFRNIWNTIRILTDNRTVINYNRNGKTFSERDVLTKFGYACKTLDVDLDTTSVAESKDHVEKLNETLQFRANRIKTCRNIHYGDF